MNLVFFTNIFNIDLLLLILMITSGAIAIVLISGKFSAVASIDLEKIQSEKERKIRHSLMEERLRRKLSGHNKIFLVGFKLVHDKITHFGKMFVNKIFELEHHYQDQMKKAWKIRFSPAEQKQKISTIIDRAYDMVKNEQYREAEKKYIEAISLDAKNTAAYKGLGKVYLYLKEFDHAKEVLKQVIKINQKDDEVFAELATVETNLGNFDQAETDMLESISQNPNLALHHIELGKIYSLKGQTEKAIQQYQEAVKLEPANPKNLNILLDAALELKNRILAQQILDALKVANPENNKIEEYQIKIDEIKKEEVNNMPT